jgi:hypothetical protein
MHRIDSPGATIGELFTEGNPSLSIPATEVSDDWLNDVQEELANFIESQGIVLVKGQQDQLEEAITNFLGAGGTNFKLDPLANNTADQVIVGLTFDSANVKSAMIFYDIHRESTTQDEQESGIYSLTRDTKTSTWRLEKIISGHDDSGTVLNVTGAGQIRATTDDLTGASYAGQIRVSGVVRMAL